MELNEFRIRKIPVNEDVRIVREILISTGFFRADEIAVAEELVTERLEKGKASGYEFLFLMHHENTIAYSCYGLIPCTVKSFDLYWLVCHNDYRGKGIGSYLLELTEKEISEIGGSAIYAETSSTDKYDPTRKFYEKNNYILKARFEEFYNDDDDKYVYVKYLTGIEQKFPT